MQMDNLNSLIFINKIRYMKGELNIFTNFAFDT